MYYLQNKIYKNIYVNILSKQDYLIKRLSAILLIRLIYLISTYIILVNNFLYFSKIFFFLN